MADGVLSFPFRLSLDGTAAVVGHGTDAEIEEALAVMVLTHLGERPMEPLYGVPDPAFVGLFAGDVQAGLDTFGPAGITATSVEMTPVSDTMARATIKWTRNENGYANG